eukprot:scaffold32418_cov61-Phaeocystis_antarctica.AAC.2
MGYSQSKPRPLAPRPSPPAPRATTKVRVRVTSSLLSRRVCRHPARVTQRRHQCAAWQAFATRGQERSLKTATPSR